MSMGKSALFVRHRAKPGHRDDVRRVWEEYVKPRIEANTAHEAYYFCYDAHDVICVLQLYSDKDSMKCFLSGEWYSGYLSEVSQLVAEEPQIILATPIWTNEVRKPVSK